MILPELEPEKLQTAAYALMWGKSEIYRSQTFLNLFSDSYIPRLHGKRENVIRVSLPVPHRLYVHRFVVRRHRYTLVYAELVLPEDTAAVKRAQRTLPALSEPGDSDPPPVLPVAEREDQTVLDLFCMAFALTRTDCNEAGILPLAEVRRALDHPLFHTNGVRLSTINWAMREDACALLCREGFWLALGVVLSTVFDGASLTLTAVEKTGEYQLDFLGVRLPAVPCSRDLLREIADASQFRLDVVEDRVLFTLPKAVDIPDVLRSAPQNDDMCFRIGLFLFCRGK